MNKQEVEKKKKGLCVELLTEILLKLPTRTLFRFCCASKAWHNLIINDEFFRDLHSQQSPHDFNPNFLFFCFDIIRDEINQCKKSFISISLFSPAIHHIIELQSIPFEIVETNLQRSELIEYKISMICNGLLCIVPSSLPDDGKISILVCNPLTLEYLTLPLLDCSDVCHYDTALGSPSSKKYKVVCLTTTWGTSDMIKQIWVYDLGADKPWRKIQTEIDFQPCISNSLYLDGKIYYVVCKPLIKSSMLVFDVESEEVTFIDIILPGTGTSCLCINSLHPKDIISFQLVHLPSSTYGVSVFTIHQDASIEVWVLKQGYCWDLRHQIKLVPHSPPSVIVAWELKDQVIQILLDNDIMVLYDRRTGVTTSIDGQLPNLCDAECHGYNPSLVSLKKYGSTRVAERFCIPAEDDQIYLPPTLPEAAS